MTPAKVRASIASGSVAPLYLLESDDVPSRTDLAQAFLAIVEEGLHAFNVATFHGRDATTAADRDAMLSAIVSGARTLPMMASHRLILLHDADALLTPRRARDEDPAEAPGGKRRARAATPMEAFEAYLAKPEPTTTLVLDAPSLDRGRRITKALLQQAVVVDCGTLESLDDAARWIAWRLQADEVTMDAAAVRALVEATGLNLSRLRAELDKLVLYAGSAGTIAASDVRDVVLPVEEPGENFALGKAIWAGQPAAALREVQVLVDGGMPAPMVLGQIRAAVGRLRPDERARAALRRVLDADLAIKSSRGEARHVIEAVVVDVCAGAPGTPAGPVRRWS
ncbi:MAG: DNA polymerase III subunit delta [Vicinamibacterales bacterium]